MITALLMGSTAAAASQSVDWKPTALPGLDRWYSFKDEATMTLSTNDITALADKSGNGRNLSAGVAPLKTTEEGKVCAYLDGTQYLRDTSNSNIPNGDDDPFTMIFTAKLDPTASNGRPITLNSSDDGDPYMSFTFNATGEITVNRRDNNRSFDVAATTSGADDLEAEFVVVTVLYTGTNLSIRVNGTLVLDNVSHNTNTISNVDRFTVGGSNQQSSFFVGFKGWIGEIILTDAVLSEANYLAAEAYMVAEWQPPAQLGEHRYWRLNGTTAGSYNGGALCEIEFYAEDGGSNIATGGTPSAGSEAFGGTAVQAFDGEKVTSFWAGAVDAVASGTSWLAYDFGSPVSIHSFEITARDGADEDQVWDGFDLEWSDDGVSWTLQRSYTDTAGWTDSEARTYSAQQDKAVPITMEYGVAASTSAFATKGNIWDIDADCEIASVIWTHSNDNSGTFDVMVAVVDSVLASGEITSLTRKTVDFTPATDELNEMFLDSPVAVTSGDLVYVALIRTNGTDTTSNGLNGGGGVAGIGDTAEVSSPGSNRGGRITENDPIVGTSFTDISSGVWSCGFSIARAPKTVAMVAIMGQSNALGRASPIDGALDATDPGVMAFSKSANRAGPISVAEDTLDHYGKAEGDIGYGLKMGKELLPDIPHDEVLLVPIAEGGSGFYNSQWQAGGTNDSYNRGKATWEAAYARAVEVYGAGAVHVYGMVWTQGEDEILDYDTFFDGTDDGLRYIGMPMQMLEAVRRSWSGFEKTTPLVWTSVPSGSNLTANLAAYNNIQGAIEDTPLTMPKCAYVDGRDLTTDDNTHWDTTSLRTMGERIAAAFPTAIDSVVEHTYPAFTPDASNVETVFAFDFDGVADNAPIVMNINDPSAGHEFDNKRWRVEGGAMVSDTDATEGELRWREGNEPTWGSRDFLIKTRLRSRSTSNAGILSEYETAGNQRSFLLRDTGSQFQFYLSSNGTTPTQMLVFTRTANTWYDLEIRRVGTALTLKVDGVEEDTYTLTGGYTIHHATVQNMQIGDYGNGNNFTGEIESISLEFLS